jgi:hypothetical protein
MINGLSPRDQLLNEATSYLTYLKRQKADGIDVSDDEIKEAQAYLDAFFPVKK